MNFLCTWYVTHTLRHCNIHESVWDVVWIKTSTVSLGFWAAYVGFVGLDGTLLHQNVKFRIWWLEDVFFSLVAFLNKIGLKIINKYYQGRRGCFTSHYAGSEIVCSVVCLLNLDAVPLSDWPTACITFWGFSQDRNRHSSSRTPGLPLWFSKGLGTRVSAAHLTGRRS